MSAVRRSSSVRPREARAVGFAWMRTAGFSPPLIDTRPTPGSCEIFGASRVSARSSTADSGSDGDERASVRIGVSAGLILL